MYNKAQIFRIPTFVLYCFSLAFNDKIHSLLLVLNKVNRGFFFLWVNEFKHAYLSERNWEGLGDHFKIKYNLHLDLW